MEPFHIVTPLLESDVVARKSQLPLVYLKMDTLQPAGTLFSWAFSFRLGDLALE